MSRVCIVVGVGPGMGLAIAKRFAKGGYQVELLARRAKEVGEYAAQLRQEGLKAGGRQVDASDPASLKAAIAVVAKEKGDVDVLVYNAAGVTSANPSSLDPEQLVRDFRTNVVGALVAAQAVIPSMKAAKKGTILFTGGGFAFEPVPIMGSLSVGKAGFRNLAFSLFKELEPEGIHAATVTIGGIVKAGTAFDPPAIAEEFWKLHEQPPGSFQRETVFRPTS